VAPTATFTHTGKLATRKGQEKNIDHEYRVLLKVALKAAVKILAITLAKSIVISIANILSSAITIVSIVNKLAFQHHNELLGRF